MQMHHFMAHSCECMYSQFPRWRLQLQRISASPPTDGPDYRGIFYIEAVAVLGHQEHLG